MWKFNQILFSSILIAFGHSLFGQLVTSTAMTPTALVEDVLVGSGVAVSGITYTGDPDAIGSFNGEATNLGLGSGIILTTGTVKNEVSGFIGEQQGPFGPNDTGSAGKANGQPGYAPLTALAGVGTENAAILEFDFIPQSDTVRFRYVFGSDEYPEYVGEGFNDVFAFFISGPGIAGTLNMAQIPGIGGPVAIDNINNGPANAGPCQNCAYYVNNGTGTTAPMDGSPFYIQYDGFTVVMEASAEVQCGETYHLKIAIADAGDQSYDSGIFLEANSLESYLPIEMEAALELDGFGDGKSMAEGCETATVTVNRVDTADLLVIPVSVEGTATEGVDFDNLPTEISFAPGASTATFSFDVFEDFIDEGDESLIIKLNHPNPCGEDNFIILDLLIVDIDPLEASVEDVDVRCAGDEVELEVIVTGGLPDYTYDWEVGGDTSFITVSAGATEEYFVTVNDICIGEPLTVSGTVTVPIYPPLTLFTSEDTAVLCPNTPLVLAAEAGGGEGSYSYNWVADGEVFSNAAFVNVSPMVTTTYSVTISDGCGAEISNDITITVIASVLELNMTPEQLICPGDTATIGVEASEGLGEYTYYWVHSAETDPYVDVHPLTTTTYFVSVEDACHTYDIVGETTVKVIQPRASFNVLSNEPMEGLPVSFFNTSTGSVAWDWDMGNGELSNMHSPSTTYDPWGWYDIELIAYNEIGCADTARKAVYVKPEFYFYAPNAFTPDGNRFNNVYEVSVIGATEFEFLIFNRWGELIYESYDPYFRWEGDYNGVIIQDQVLVYKAQIKDLEGNMHLFEGIITLLK
jgi:gliding motility-associated-like protein